MTQNDPIANALTSIKNHELAARKRCTINYSSKLLEKILEVMKKTGYIEAFEEKNGRIRVFLAGKINECKAIKPRYAVKKDNFEKYEKRYLPSRKHGTIIVSTPQGLLSHIEAKEKRIGGRLIAFIF